MLVWSFEKTFSNYIVVLQVDALLAIGSRFPYEVSIILSWCPQHASYVHCGDY